ncbi:MAG: T9SS type A sorting domain-containing protein [Candidatus Delongbacteria bacterium]|nr:T9SS type A sorting domain-containing protein [Candidatus Delongbacteria bacterium]MBN2833948.1 T9SS type A sorting domain-containing protein [Candidatus Delongbacteria bacterium]
MKKLYFCILVFVCFVFADLPTNFDLRNVNGENYVTSVKSQQGGTCWTHATMAVMESNLLKSNDWLYTYEPDLAEYHLDWWNGFNQNYNGDLENPTGTGLEVHMGGDYLVSAAYLARTNGAVANSSAQSFDNPPEYYDYDYDIYSPEHIEWYTMDDELNGIEEIKQAIIDYGAIGTCMFYNNAFIDWDYNHYQPATSNELPNHAVTIIGWDDERITQAPNAGAWLVKNSWGTGWGHDGYFWISYYDKWSCREPFMGAVSMRGKINYGFLNFQDSAIGHDYHGWRDTLEDVSIAMNHFDQEDSPYIIGGFSWIDGYGIITATDNCEVTITTASDFEFQNIIDNRTVLVPKRGFHYIETENMVGIMYMSDIYVKVELSNGGHAIDRTSDIPVLLGGVPGKTIVESTADYNESFYFQNGEWLDLKEYDLGDYTGSANFCIKIYAEHEVSIEETIAENHGIISSYPNPFNPETNISFVAEGMKDVRIVVYNSKGESVKEFNVNNVQTGIQSVKFNASNLPSGVYNAAIFGNNRLMSSSKMVLIK